MKKFILFTLFALLLVPGLAWAECKGNESGTIGQPDYQCITGGGGAQPPAIYADNMQLVALYQADGNKVVKFLSTQFGRGAVLIDGVRYETDAIETYHSVSVGHLPSGTYQVQPIVWKAATASAPGFAVAGPSVSLFVP